MNFMFSWQEQYLTRSLRLLVRYSSCHSKIKFISSRHRVISSIYVSSKVFSSRILLLNQNRLAYLQTHAWYKHLSSWNFGRETLKGLAVFTFQRELFFRQWLILYCLPCQWRLIYSWDIHKITKHDYSPMVSPVLRMGKKNNDSPSKINSCKICLICF